MVFGGPLQDLNGSGVFKPGIYVAALPKLGFRVLPIRTSPVLTLLMPVNTIRAQLQIRNTEYGRPNNDKQLPPDSSEAAPSVGAMKPN